MRNRFAVLCLVAVGLLGVSVPLFAHHGNAAYDSSKTVTVKGTVTEYLFANPHVIVKIDVKDEGGNIVHWNVEGQNPVSMVEKGWGKNTFKPGDEVTIEVITVKNGQPIGKVSGRVFVNGREIKS